MSEPYIGEIRLVGFNFAPVGWALCDGATMDISQNETLFNLIGTTYGGDGVTIFNLPDLQGRVPLHIGTTQNTTFVIGESSGTETVTVLTSQLPSHTHAPVASNGGGTANSPANNTWASWTGAPYATASPGATLSVQAIGQTGGNQPHDNLMPFQVVNFIIALDGIYPSQG